EHASITRSLIGTSRGERMKVHSYQETIPSTSTCLKRRAWNPVKSPKGSSWISMAGQVVGIDIDHASRIVDLSRLESEALPIPKVKKLASDQDLRGGVLGPT